VLSGEGEDLRLLGAGDEREEEGRSGMAAAAQAARREEQEEEDTGLEERNWDILGGDGWRRRCERRLAYGSPSDGRWRTVHGQRTVARREGGVWILTRKEEQISTMAMPKEQVKQETMTHPHTREAGRRQRGPCPG
jgi:hypothetical protein